jgi:N-acetylglucosamine kinase-like BadF-type ATPase
LAELDRCIESAFAAAGIERSRVAGAGLGLAGIDRQEGLDVIHGWANRVGLAGSIQVANDATLLLAAGTPNGWGLAIIAGTGSIAFGRTPDGRIDRAGGWGYTLGDEGSAYMLAIEALRAVARSSDGVLPPTQLTQAILKRFGLQTPAELIPAVYRGGWDRQKIATLAPLVLETAESDNVAAIIVQKAAADLADTALAAARKLDLPRTGLPLALTGGAILGNANYRQQFLDAVAARGLRVDPVTLVHDPAEGAVRIARSLVGAAS